MAQTLGACCISGTIHEGTPNGRTETVGGLETYVSEPEGGSKSKTVVFLTDIFGHTLKNTQLLADQYAKAGFYVYVPDILEGDGLPADFLNTAEPSLKEREQKTMTQKGVDTAKVAATLGPWMVKHREAVTKPIIDGFLNHVRSVAGTNKVGTVGFCFGGRHAVLTAQGGVDAAFACHPTGLSIPNDIDPVDKPVAFAVGDKDSMMPDSEITKLKETLEKRSDIQSEVKVYADQVHGFALRSDWSSDMDKKAMDDALNQGVTWFNRYLS